MANQLYGSWLQNLLETYFGVEDKFTVDPVDLFVCGVNDSYTFDSSDQIVEDLGANVVMEPVPLLGVTLTNGLLKADVTVADVEDDAGNSVEALVIFCANEDGSRLIAYIDEGQPTQLPLILARGKFYFRWNPAGIFRI